MSRYRKIETRVWGDEKFRQLSPIPACGQGLWFYLLTGPHTGPIPGLFRAGRAGLAEELGWEPKAFDKAFRELSDLGMVKADFGARLVWIPNAIKLNLPASPNVVTLWGREFDLLPHSFLKAEALASMQTFMGGMSEAFAEAFRKAFRKALANADLKASIDPSRNQEQQQDKQRISSHGGASLSQDRARDGAAANGQAQGWSDDAPFDEEAA